MDIDGSMLIRSFLTRLPTAHPKRSLIECLGQDMFVVPSASLISRKAFQAVGGFDESLSGYEDDDLFLRMFRAGYDNVQRFTFAGAAQGTFREDPSAVVRAGERKTC
jgi:GT2 family glycosyltransferase